MDNRHAPDPTDEPSFDLREEGEDEVPTLRLHLGDDRGAHLAETLALPLVEPLSLDGRMTDLLDHVAATRRGAVLVGPKGCGKSLALGRAVALFERQEALHERRNDGYARRLLLRLPSLTARRYTDALEVLCRQVIRLAFHARIRGGRKQDDDLRRELLLACRDQRVVALLIDEADRLSADGLALLRDLMAEAEDHEAEATTPDGGRLATGLGILLVGTPSLRARVATTDEAAQRWSRMCEVDRLTVDQAAEALLTWFPAWRPAVERIGAKAFTTLLADHLADGTAVTWRTLENHARLYFRYLQRNAQTRERAYTRERAPYNEMLFLYAARQVRWATGQSTARDAARGSA